MERVKLNVIVVYKMSNDEKILEITCDSLDELDLEKASLFVDLNYCIRKYKTYKGFLNRFTKVRFNERLYKPDCWLIFKAIDKNGDIIENQYLNENIWDMMRFGYLMGCEYNKIKNKE